MVLTNEVKMTIRQAAISVKRTAAFGGCLNVAPDLCVGRALKADANQEIGAHGLPAPRSGLAGDGA